MSDSTPFAAASGARLWALATFSVALAALLVAACNGDDASSDTDASSATDADAAPAPDASPGYTADLLSSFTHTAGDRTWDVHLYRITRPDGLPTYVQWIPRDATTPVTGPAVLATMPYDGIDWSEDPLDLRWAASTPQPDGRYLDVDGPGFDGDDLIAYYPLSAAAAAGQSNVHLINGASVLLVYGRFYAGGSVRDDVEDMKAGMWFLAEQPEVDPARVGTFGASWGGFESLYASAYGDRRVAPIVTVALFPPADFATWLTHAHTRTDPTLTALIPYVRRIHAATGGDPSDSGADFSGLRVADLCDGLPAATFTVHDDIDNLVPISESENLLATCGGDAVYWRRAAAPDPSAATHGDLLAEPTLPSAYLYAWAYLHLRLASPDDTVLEIYAAPALNAHLATVRSAQQRGEDVTFAAPRLLELTDARLFVLEATSMELISGAEAVARAVNATWGTTYTAANIAGAPASGLPPPT
jgi:hypothetical protein